MKQSIDELKRMQRLAGLITESEYNEQLEELNLKNLATGAAMTAATMFGGGNASAQSKLSNQEKPAITQQATKQTSTNKSTTARIGTQVDGIIGSFTSQFQFPGAVLHNLDSKTTTNLGVEGNKAMQEMKGLLTSDQMKEWNSFQKWLSNKGYAGDVKMDHGGFDKTVLADYKKEKPDFWVKGPDDIKKVQASIKAYRNFTIAQWKAGQANIEIGGKDLKPGVDDSKLSGYMTWAM